MHLKRTEVKTLYKCNQFAFFRFAEKLGKEQKASRQNFFVAGLVPRRHTPTLLDAVAIAGPEGTRFGVFRVDSTAAELASTGITGSYPVRYKCPLCLAMMAVE
jgi:hypothetical protein